MIDTIVIKIKYPDFIISNPELFSPDLIIRSENEIPAEWRFKPQKVFKKYIQNTSADDKAEGIYKPSLTVYRSYVEQKIEYILHIQFSAPKLLNSNNIQEIGERDLTAILSTLQYKLQTMGITVTQKQLSISEVAKVHFGKNIGIEAPITIADITAEIRKADMGKNMELNQRDYRNGGEALYFYNGSHNHIFYDKGKDLQKVKNRSADKDKTTMERRLGYALEKSKTQILRFETRFTNLTLIRKIVNSSLKTKHEVITLEIVFSEYLWKKCLIDEWHSIISRPANQLAFKTKVSPEDALNLLIARQTGKKSNGHTLNKVLISFGLYLIINYFGVKIFKHKIARYWDKKTCGDRLDQKIREAVTELADIPLSENISLIERALQDFEPYQLTANI